VGPAAGLPGHQLPHREPDQFAADVDKASGGKLKITVHANASLFKAPEIKRAVQGGQAQIGEVLMNFQNEWQMFGADGLPFLADSYDESSSCGRPSAAAREEAGRAGHDGCCTPCRGRRRASTARSR
jgi:TRAP-type C4-dicarboxylate transport system substrate-binding protein